MAQSTQIKTVTLNTGIEVRKPLLVDMDGSTYLHHYQHGCLEKRRSLPP